IPSSTLDIKALNNRNKKLSARRESRCRNVMWQWLCWHGSNTPAQLAAPPQPLHNRAKMRRHCCPTFDISMPEHCTNVKHFFLRNYYGYRWQPDFSCQATSIRISSTHPLKYL